MRQLIYLLIIIPCFASNSLAQTENGESVQEILTDPIELASFPGGIDSLRTFIARNLIRPSDEKVGTVYVAFFVNGDGTTSEFEVLRGLSTKHDVNAIEVLRKMPNWIPGRQQGVKVRQRFVMPVKFE